MQFTNPMYYILCLVIAHYLTVIFPKKYFKVKSHTKILSLSQYQRKHLKLCINILEKLRLLSCSIYPFQQMRKNDKGRNVQNAGLWERLVSVQNIANDDIPVNQHILLVDNLKVIKKRNHLPIFFFFVFRDWCKLPILMLIFKLQHPIYMPYCVFSYMYTKSLTTRAHWVLNAQQQKNQTLETRKRILLSCLPYFIFKTYNGVTVPLHMPSAKCQPLSFAAVRVKPNLLTESWQ